MEAISSNQDDADRPRFDENVITREYKAATMAVIGNFTEETSFVRELKATQIAGVAQVARG